MTCSKDRNEQQPIRGKQKTCAADHWIRFYIPSFFVRAYNCQESIRSFSSTPNSYSHLAHSSTIPNTTTTPSNSVSQHAPCLRSMQYRCAQLLRLTHTHIMPCFTPILCLTLSGQLVVNLPKHFLCFGLPVIGPCFASCILDYCLASV